MRSYHGNEKILILLEMKKKDSELMIPEIFHFVSLAEILREVFFSQLNKINKSRHECLFSHVILGYFSIKQNKTCTSFYNFGPKEGKPNSRKNYFLGFSLVLISFFLVISSGFHPWCFAIIATKNTKS